MTWRPKCKVCMWLRQTVKRQEGEESNAELESCDSKHPRILKSLHTKPDNTWIAIISTNRLCAPTWPIIRKGRNWACFPLRCDRYVESSNCRYKYEGCWKDAHEVVLGFHNTRVESLVTGTCFWDDISIGEGILRDGRLRYGCCGHRGNRGVYVYSDGGLETFEGYRGWVQLEVLCTNTTSLKGGREERYCINGPQGAICKKVAIIALWVPYEEVPKPLLVL